jgi:hypothetical protein
MGGTELGGVSTGGIDYVFRRLRGRKVALRAWIDQAMINRAMNLACTVFIIFSSLGRDWVGSEASAP